MATSAPTWVVASNALASIILAGRKDQSWGVFFLRAPFVVCCVTGLWCITKWLFPAAPAWMPTVFCSFAALANFSWEPVFIGTTGVACFMTGLWCIFGWLSGSLEVWNSSVIPEWLHDAVSAIRDLLGAAPAWVPVALNSFLALLSSLVLTDMKKFADRWCDGLVGSMVIACLVTVLWCLLRWPFPAARAWVLVGCSSFGAMGSLCLLDGDSWDKLFTMSTACGFWVTAHWAIGNVTGYLCVGSVAESKHEEEKSQREEQEEALRQERLQREEQDNELKEREQEEEDGKALEVKRETQERLQLEENAKEQERAEREREREKVREQELHRHKQEWEREKEQEWKRERAKEARAKAEREAKAMEREQEWERERSRLEQEREKEAQTKAEREAKEKEREQEWEQERSRLLQEMETFLRERELWQQRGLNFPQDPPGTALLEAAPPLNGSEEFWLHTLAKLRGVLDEEDIAEAASRLSAAKFKQRHVGKLSQDDLLVLAKIAPAVARDLLKHQHLLLDRSNGSDNSAAGNLAMSLFAASSLPRIPEEELTMEEEVGEGAFSMVWRATWTRKIAVGQSGVSSVQVAVKMSNKANSNNNKDLAMLARDLAVISGLPHQNILTVHGVCEPTLRQNNSMNGNMEGRAKIVYELMTTDLAELLQEGLLLPTQLLRVLRDVSAGLAHLHAHGVIHRDVKPANVLLRDDQVKLCDFGSSRDLQHTMQQMSVAGTLEYMAPEVLNKQAGRPADVWSFGVLLFYCVTGKVCGRDKSMEELVAELTQRKCLPALVQLFMECHQVDPRERPSMFNIHTRLQTLVMQEARDSQRVREELKRAEAQDKETYEVTWTSHCDNQPHSQELLGYLRQTHSQQSPVVRQPLVGKGSMTELEQLAFGRVCSQLHTQLKAFVEECGGTYLCAPRKSYERCVQKVKQEYDGDYSKLLDLERATGLFEQAEDMLRCLRRVQGAAEEEKGHVVQMGQASSAPPLSLRVVRCKDRMNEALSSGYRDILLNVCEAESGFIMELQLNFHKIAQIKSQSHRFYELLRVMEIKLE